MPLFLLKHTHRAHECAPAYAAWHGFDSRLRHERALSTCLAGGHRLFWIVEAIDVPEAVALLPRFVARRTVAVQVREVEIP